MPSTFSSRFNMFSTTGGVSPPNDPWQGRQRGYLMTLTAKNILFIFFAILVVIERLLYKSWRWRDGSVDDTYGPSHFWVRLGIYILVDSVMTLVMAILIAKRRWHPITALVVSILWFGLWFAGGFINVLVVYSNEISFYNVDAWSNLAYLEAAMQFLLAILYLGMMWFAAVAVHRRRMAKRRNIINQVPLKTVGDDESVNTV